jgi:hypothetical protein
MADISIDDAEAREFAEIFLELFKSHHRALLKAPLIGLMVLFSVYVITGSVFKGLAVGFLCCCISVFRTWRRFLEPLSFAMFCLAIFILCDHGLTAHLKGIATR